MPPNLFASLKCVNINDRSSSKHFGYLIIRRAFDEARACVIASLAIQLARLPVIPVGRNQ